MRSPRELHPAYEGPELGDRRIPVDAVKQDFVELAPVEEQLRLVVGRDQLPEVHVRIRQPREGAFRIRLGGVLNLNDLVPGLQRGKQVVDAAAVPEQGARRKRFRLVIIIVVAVVVLVILVFDDQLFLGHGGPVEHCEVLGGSPVPAVELAVQKSRLGVTHLKQA